MEVLQSKRVYKLIWNESKHAKVSSLAPAPATKIKRALKLHPKRGKALSWLSDSNGQMELRENFHIIYFVRRLYSETSCWSHSIHLIHRIEKQQIHFVWIVADWNGSFLGQHHSFFIVWMYVCVLVALLMMIPMHLLNQQQHQQRQRHFSSSTNKFSTCQNRL